jgi:peptidylprolyl isomerase
MDQSGADHGSDAPAGYPPPPAPGYPPPPAGYPPPPPFVGQPGPSGFALASVILGASAVLTCVIGSVLAIVFGHIALARIRRAQPPEGGRGLAIAGLVLGYAGVALTAAGILFLVAVDGDSDSGDVSPRPTITTSTTEIDGAPSSPPPEDDVDTREPPMPEPPPADTPSDALEVETLIEGAGAPVTSGDTVTAHYVGVLADGTVFDSSREHGEPLAFTVGQGQVIVGWDQGLLGAQVGERRRLVIGADNAYGAQGASDVIPPNAPLAFEVDILDVS